MSKTTIKDDDDWARSTKIWKLSSNHEFGMEYLKKRIKND